MKPRGKDFYDRLGNRVNNVLKSRYPNITRFTKAGSRKRGDFQRTSDLDIRFSLSGDPQRVNIYPKLKEYFDDKLSTFNGEKMRYKIGEEGHAFQIYPANGGKIDIFFLLKMNLIDKRKNEL